jgi:hypothetical protein|tara:strand:+ start:193 stop:624 length:432 start_codon:yes stop_codon:yes gene_type:complete
MASTYKYPEDFISWFIKGNHLAIVTLKGETSGSTHAKYGQYKPIDEAVTHGVLIHYQAEPNAVSAITDTPDVDNVFHTCIIDYVKARLYQDKAGTTGDANVAGVSMNLSAMHEGKWNEAVKRHGMQKRDKTGGDRRIFMTDFT